MSELIIVSNLPEFVSVSDFMLRVDTLSNRADIRDLRILILKL